MIILKVCAAAIAAVILISLIRSYKPELTAEAILCASILLLTYLVGSFAHSFSYLEELFTQVSGSRTYFPIILKTLGIAYVTEFTSALCTDAGETSIAGKVELAGKIAIFFTAIPVFQSLMNLLNSLI